MSDDALVMRCFKQCLDVTEAERDALLAAQDDEVARRVRALLAADAREDVVEDGFGQGAVELLADEDIPDTLPDHIGPYRVIALAGHGSTSLVYEARESVPRRTVAVKVARAQLGPDLHLRFEAEAHALSAVHHPAVPVVYQVGSVSGVPWLAMEWVDGPPLAEVELDTEELVDVVISLCGGVAAAHAKGLVHGDISPNNVLITSQGTPKLLDFGLVAAPGERVHARGTPGYFSPVSETPTADERRDVYALGRLLDDAELDTPLAAVVAACREEHYCGVGALEADLRHWRADEPVSVYEDRPSERVARWLRHNRSAWRLVLATALLAAGVGVLLVGVAELRDLRLEGLRERTASDRLAELERVVAESPATGPEVLRDFATDPRWGGTQASVRAWRSLASVLAQSDRVAEARDALAQAFALSNDADEREEIAQQLANDFRLARSWTSLSAVAGYLGEPAAACARSHAAAGQRDLVLAAEAAARCGSPLASVFERFQHATVSEHHSVAVSRVDSEHLALLDERSRSLFLVQATPELPVVDRHSLDAWLVGGGTPDIPFEGAFAYVERSGSTQARLAELGQVDGQLTLTPRTEAPAWPISFAALPGEEGMRYFAGYGPGRRDLLDITAEPFPAHDATSAARSDVTELQAVEVDGQPRLIVVLGPWQAYDMRLFAWTDGQLSLLDRVQLGTIGGLEVVEQDGETWVLASKSRGYANATVFGDEDPAAGPPGLFRIPLRADGLGQPVRLDFPGEPLSVASPNRVVTGDFDADGRADAVVGVGTPESGYSWLIHDVLGPDPAMALLGSVAPMYATDLDGQPGDELVARLPDDDQRVWVLGGGKAVPPLVPHVAESDLDGPGHEGPQAQLAGLGLYSAAAQAAERVASSDGGAEQWLWAGRAWRRAERLDRAERALLHALDAARSDEAWTDAAEVLMAVYDEHVDLDGQRALLEHPSAPTDWVTTWSTRVERDAPTDVVSFAPSLAEIELVQPAAVRLPIPSPSVDLSLVTDSGDVLRVPLERHAERFAVEFDVDSSRLELGAGVRVALWDVEGQRELGAVMVLARGGGSTFNYAVECHYQSNVSQLAERLESPFDPTEGVRLSWVVDTRGDALHCQVQRDGTVLMQQDGRGLGPVGERLELRVAGAPLSTEPGTLAQVRLGPVELRGLARAEVPRDALQDAHRVLLEPDPLAAAERYRELGEPVLVALAESDGGHSDEAVAALKGHLDEPTAAALHRLRPEMARLIARADPAGYPQRVLNQVGSGLRYPDAPDIGAILAHPALDSVAARSPLECLLLFHRARRFYYERATYRASDTLAHLQRTAGDKPEMVGCRSSAYALSARHRLRAGDRVRAAEALRQAIAIDPVPELARERYERDAELSPLLADP